MNEYLYMNIINSDIPDESVVKNPPGKQKTQVPSLDREDSLEKKMATHSSILAGKNPMDREAWWATVHSITKSQTQLKRLSTQAPRLFLFFLPG